MNVKWKNVTVRQLCKMNQSSYTSKDHWEYVNYLDTGSITRNVIDGYEHIDLTKVKLPSRAKRKVAVGDIIYSTVRPNLCHYGMLGEIPENCLVSTGFAVIKTDEAEVNPLFLYYYLTLPEIVESLHSIGEQGQATYPAINPSDIEDLEISIPERIVQNKIVAILSDYDAAIANCRKQIVLLEEAAMRLYREWLGDVKGEKVPLRDFIYFQEGPGIRNWQYVKLGGVRFINIRCINNGDVDVSSASMISYDEAFGKYKHFQLEEDDIVMSCSGTLGRTAVIRKDHLPLCLNTSVIRFRPKLDDRDYSYVYCYLNSDDFLQAQRTMANGAAQLNFGPKHLNLIQMDLPKKEMRYSFNEQVLPMLGAKKEMYNQIRSLSEARDRLLPKLMKGEIEV